MRLSSKFLALGRMRAGKLNRLEEAYRCEVLEPRVAAGEILWYKFEGVTLRLADNRCHYTPDFVVMLSDNVLEMHEVKGFWTDDARVKIKVAAEQFPFRFIAIRRIKRQWVEEMF